METLGTMWSGGMARVLVSGLPNFDTIYNSCDSFLCAGNQGMGDKLWDHFKRVNMADEDSIRDCYEQQLLVGWLSDDGRHSLASPAYFFHTHKVSRLPVQTTI